MRKAPELVSKARSLVILGNSFSSREQKMSVPSGKSMSSILEGTGKAIWLDKGELGNKCSGR